MAEEKKNYVPIYYGTPEEAFAESVMSPEAQAFMASFKATDKCVSDIQGALSRNRESDGKFTSTDFIEDILDEHGKDRVEYVLASYIRSREYETADFSDEVKSWARGVRVSDSPMVANTIIVAGGDDMVNALAGELRLMDLYEEKESDVAVGTPEKDYNIEASEKADATNPTNIDVPEAGEETQANKNVTKNDDGSITVKMPEVAVIRRYQTSAVLCMPRNQGYDMFRYMVDVKCFRENGDGTVSVTLGTNDNHTLTIRRRGREVKLDADKLYEAFSGAVKEDYVPQKYTIEIPTDAVQGNYPNMIRCKFPENSLYAGQHVVIPSVLKDELKSNDEKIVFSIPDYMNFSVRDKDGEDLLISVSEVAREVKFGTYKKAPRWVEADIPEEAVLLRGEKQTLFKMPKDCSLSEYVYSVPNGMAPSDGHMNIKMRIPEDGKVRLHKEDGTCPFELPASSLKGFVAGRDKNSYLPVRSMHGGDGPAM